MDLTERIPVDKATFLKTMPFADFLKLKKFKSKDEAKLKHKMMVHFCEGILKGRGVCKRLYGFSDKTEEGATGRLYSGGSVQGLPKNVRGFLMSHTADIDMGNAHPTILKWLCTKHKIPCPNLALYIQDREVYTSQIPEGKDAYLSALNNDKMNYKIKNAFFNAFDKEMKVIQRTVYGMPEYELYMSTPSTRPYNWLGSSLNRILCKYENDILQVALKTLARLGIEVAVLMFDGCMVYHPAVDGVLVEIAKDVDEAFSGLNMKWKYKEHSTDLSIPDDWVEPENKAQLSDMEATLELLKTYPHWKQCGALYVFDERTGMWSKDTNIHIYYISKYGTGDHATKANLIRNVLTLLPSQVNAPDWMEKMEDTSLGYLLFTNGIYSFKDHQFSEQFDPAILFFHRIEYDYSDRSYDIKDRIFYQQHGEEMGDYLIELLARALAGDCLKNIGLCLGTTNGGSGRRATDDTPERKPPC